MQGSRRLQTGSSPKRDERLADTPFAAASDRLPVGRLAGSEQRSEGPFLSTKFDIRDDLPPHRARRVFGLPAPRPQPAMLLVAAVFTALICAALCVGAILAPAPKAAVPLIALICVGCPMLAGWEVPTAVASLRARRSGGRALAMLRRSLDQLPETEHPLGL